VIATIGLWGADEDHEGMDRTTIEIPPAQTEWLKKLYEVNPNIVCVVHVGSSLAMTWAADNTPAIVNYWYPGQEGGHALADVLFGDYNPAGRLPITFYYSDDQLFPLYYYEIFTDIRRGGRTYMYLKGQPLYAFGHGLSYTTFEYSNLRLSKDKVTDKDAVRVSVDVKNIGPIDGDEVVQVYIHNACSKYYQPTKQLKGFSRMRLKSGETKTVSIAIPVKNLHYWDVIKKCYVVDKGEYDIIVGGSSSDIRLRGKLSKH
jgi:beta-glucosidase